MQHILALQALQAQGINMLDIEENSTSSGSGCHCSTYSNGCSPPSSGADNDN